jgi:hypothetical protein
MEFNPNCTYILHNLFRDRLEDRTIYMRQYIAYSEFFYSSENIKKYVTLKTEVTSIFIYV